MEWLYELKRLYPDCKDCDYFIESKIGPTPSNPSNSSVRTIYGLLLGNNYDPSMESGINAGGISSGITIEITLTNNFTNPHLLQCFILHDRWINISPNGSTTLVE
jgi:hypothetical protein